MGTSKNKPKSKSSSNKAAPLAKRMSLNPNALGVFLALFALVGGYALFGHTLAASGSPEVQLAMDGGKYCLDDFQGSLGKAGAPAVVDSWPCNGTGPQQWSWHTNADSVSTIEVQGQCLDIYRSGTVNGTKVDLFPCNGGQNQLWQRYGSEVVSLLAPDKCLEAPYSVPETQLDIWTCNFGQNQYWTDTTYAEASTSGSSSSSTTSNSSSTTPLPYCNATYSNKPCWPQPPTSVPANPFSTTGASSSTQTIINDNGNPSVVAKPNLSPTGSNSVTNSSSTNTSTNNASSTTVVNQKSGATAAQTGSQPYSAALTSGISGKCLDDYKNASKAGNAIDSYVCNGTSAQDWTITTSSSNPSIHQITLHSLCMAVANGGTTSGDLVDLVTCSSSPSTNWAQVGTTLQDNATATGTHLCLTNPGSATSNGNQLEVDTCNASASQAWEMPSSAAAAPAMASNSKSNVMPTQGSATSPIGNMWASIVHWFQMHW